MVEEKRFKASEEVERDRTIIKGFMKKYGKEWKRLGESKERV